MGQELQFKILTASLGLLLALLVWLAKRFVEQHDALTHTCNSIQMRLLTVERKLDNGIHTELETLREDVDKMAGAEARILRWCDENLRERRGPPRGRHDARRS